MRLTLSTLALILAPLSINAAASKNDFMQAMRSTKINNNNKKDRKARLNASILASAKPVPPSNALPLTSTSTRKTRSLYYDDAVAADDAAAADAADDAVAADDGAAAADDEDYSEYGFEMSSYSMKYAGCSSIATFSDELAEDEDAETVFEIDQYAVFRFCPSDTCSDSSISGCSSDYGEYMVPLETWLTIIAEYRDEEFERYCEYCAACYGTDDDASAANCAYKTACSGYADVCNDDYVDYSGFFECREYDASDDLIVYLGPHCAADKATIVLAVFDDAYCSQYSSDSYDIGTLTGGVLTSESLAEYYEEECIACKESVSAVTSCSHCNAKISMISWCSHSLISLITFTLNLPPINRHRTCHSKIMMETTRTRTTLLKCAKPSTDTLPNATDKSQAQLLPLTNPTNRKTTNTPYAPSSPVSSPEPTMKTDTFT